ncbi:polysaccharide biosynthesis/export family protein [Hirschia litorea]|uniref:Polysaccharide biosynthesis/export family protein n=1 Tax=Hirschia litorea TaxID=1199156 RepID=A0ABW2IGB3_9PROT
MNVLGRLKIAIAATLLLTAAACSTPATSTQTDTSALIKHPAASTTTQEVVSNNAPLSPNQNAKPTDSLGYKLGNGDTLRVTVFGEPDLSGEFQVDGTGMISVPLIGEVEAAGNSVRQVQRAMEDRFRQGYLNNPRISAEVINFRPYYILGEVNRPGEYPYSDGLTVLNAIATAEGYTYRANKQKIFVRASGGMEEREVKLTSTTPVNPGDTLRVGERLF